MKRRIATLLLGGAAIALAILPLIPGAAHAQTTTEPQTAAKPSFAPEASENDIEGEQMFATSCGFCHESGGRVAGKGPKLQGTTRSDEFIIERIKKGKLGSMPAFGRVFSDGQIVAILAYIRGLD